MTKLSALILLAALLLRPTEGDAQWWSAAGAAVVNSTKITPPPTVVSISPTSKTITDNFTSGQTLWGFTCAMSDGSTCPPPAAGYIWSISNGPSFLAINSTTGMVTANRSGSSSDDGYPSFDNYTFSVTIAPAGGTPVVAGIAPTSLNILTTTALGTTYQFTCTMSDGGITPCINRAWSFSNVPSFLTVGQNATGGTLAVNAAPPVGAGTLTATADGFSQPVSWTVTGTATVASISPTSLNIPNTTVINTQFRFSCTMSDNSPCTGKSWSFANYPSFLTPSSDATGGILTTNQAPPLPVSSGTLSVTAN